MSCKSPPTRHDPRACIEHRIRSLREHAAEARRDLAARENPPETIARRVLDQAAADVLQANWLAWELDTMADKGPCPLAGTAGRCRGCGT